MVVGKRDTGVLCALQAEARLPAGRQARELGERPIIYRRGHARLGSEARAPARQARNMSRPPTMLPTSSPDKELAAA